MRLHPLAWTVWLGAVAVSAVVVSNPFLLVLLAGAILLVPLGGPPDPSPAGRAVRMFLVAGLVLLAVRLVLVGLLPNPGRTVLATLPRVELPRALGGFGLGGPLTAEVLVESATDGLRLLCVLLAFGVVNARLDLAAVVRMVPPVFRDAGLVVSIAVAFVPGLLRTVGDVRDAQRLRGERGLRLLAPSLAVPILGLSLERALLLAESMDARGYGRDARPRTGSRTILAGLLAVLAGVTVWVLGVPAAAVALVGGGAVLLVAGLRSASRASSTTRLAPPAWRVRDTLVTGAAASVAAVLVASGGAVAYTAYPAVSVPDLPLPAALAVLGLAAPVAAELSAGRPAAEVTA